MKQNAGKYRTLFLSTFQLSACTFGGGFVIIPLMRKKFVEQLQWIEEQEMMDMTAIAQSWGDRRKCLDSCWLSYSRRSRSAAYPDGICITAANHHFIRFNVLYSVS